MLREAAKKAAPYGYDEVNLNCGCPSRPRCRRRLLRGHADVAAGSGGRVHAGARETEHSLAECNMSAQISGSSRVRGQASRYD